jgi:hypothetical protein
MMLSDRIRSQFDQQGQQAAALPAERVATQLSTKALLALCSTIYGPAVEMLCSNVDGTEARRRLATMCYCDHLEVPGLAKDYEAISKRFERPKLRGVTRSVHCMRQARTDAWCKANGFESAQ